MNLEVCDVVTMIQKTIPIKMFFAKWNLTLKKTIVTPLLGAGLHGVPSPNMEAKSS